MKRSPLKTLLHLFLYATGEKTRVLLATLFTMLNTFFDVLPEVLIGFAVDIVVYQKESWLGKLGLANVYQQLMALGGITFAVWCLESIFQYGYSIEWRGLAQRLQHRLRMDAYTHLQNTDIGFFEQVSSGQLTSILNDDINQLERFLDTGLSQAIKIITTVLIIGGIFFFISPKVAGFAFLPMPIVLFGTYFFRHLIGPRYEAVRARAGEIAKRLVNNIQGIATIKSYVTEPYEIQALQKKSLAYQSANISAIRLSSAITPIIRIAILMGFLSTLLYGGQLTLQHHLPISTYTVLVFLTQRLLWPLTYLADVTDLFYRAMASASRVLDLLTLPTPIISAEKTPPDKLRGDILFKQISFAYQDRSPILTHLNLVAKAGTCIGIIGSTGSGKSTLVKLLLRFYDPQSGHILLDGKSIQEYSLSFLRKNIAYVSQDPFLFDGSIAENIAYGSFHASQAEIEHAARLSEAHDFIVTLPKSYETQIGERGQRLSGGQQQRISIARAILKNPPILILDEATSSVDNETEAAIQRSLKHIVVGRTTLIIAHRLSTVREADQIFVLDQGKIAEVGKHDELIQNAGLYANLWKLQTGDTTRNCP